MFIAIDSCTAFKQARCAVLQLETVGHLQAILPVFQCRRINCAHAPSLFSGQAAEELPAILVEGQCRHAVQRRRTRRGLQPVAGDVQIPGAHLRQFQRQFQTVPGLLEDALRACRRQAGVAACAGTFSTELSGGLDM